METGSGSIFSSTVKITGKSGQNPVNGGASLDVAQEIFLTFFSNGKSLLKENSKGRYGLCFFLLSAMDHYEWIGLQDKIPDCDTIFLLILTRFRVWIKALDSDFPYCALDLLLSGDGLKKGSNIKKISSVVGRSPGEHVQILRKWRPKREGKEKGAKEDEEGPIC